MTLIGAPGFAFAETVQDFNKTVINRVPYNVEVCTNQTVSGDKTADTLKGAIIGGVIGNNVGDVDNGGAIGVIIGGMLDITSNAIWWYTKRVCEVQTRYNEESVTIYSHSVVTFYHEGKQYKLRS